MAARSVQAWDELYGQTDQLVWGREPMGFLRDFASRLKPRLTGASRVLDAAAGEGRNLPFLLETKARVHACDASVNALGKLGPAIRKQVRCVRCDLARLPFRPDSFAFVLLADVIETLPGPESVLKDIHRILEPGGLFLCNVPGFDDGIAGIDMKPLPDGGYLYRDRYYYRFHSEAQAVALLERCGLETMECKTYEWVEPPHPRFRDEPHHHTSRIFLAQKG